MGIVGVIVWYGVNIVCWCSDFCVVIVVGVGLVGWGYVLWGFSLLVVLLSGVDWF